MEKNASSKDFRFNLIDVLLILIVIAAAIGLFLSLRGRRVVTGRDETVELVYQIEVAPLREEFRNLVAVGDRLTDPETALTLGEVTNVAYAAYSHIGTDRATGAEVSTPVPGQYTMTITVKATAVVTDSGYTVGGRAAALGRDLAFRVPDFEGTGAFVALTKAASSLNE